MSQTWKIRIADAYCEHEYTVIGRDTASIQDVAECVADFLNDDDLKQYATIRRDSCLRHKGRIEDGFIVSSGSEASHLSTHATDTASH